YSENTETASRNNITTSKIAILALYFRYRAHFTASGEIQITELLLFSYRACTVDNSKNHENQVFSVST
ncbi:MAG: hypothetical protein QXZ17_15955, partial [Nitrososphaerota archaeon]